MAGRFTVVVGERRSGTSAMMQCLRQCGIPIVGYKFPAKIKNEDLQHIDAGCEFSTDQKVIALNPRGFWECSSVIENGLSHQHEKYDGEVIKVLTRHFPRTHPDLINKVIFMVRNPHKLIGSRINLGELKKGDDFTTRIYLLVMMNNTIVSFNWMREKSKSFKIVVYEELLEDPVRVMSDVCGWLERGDAKWAEEVITKKLNRSELIQIDCEEMVEADMLYNTLKSRDFEKIYRYDIKAINDKYHKLYAERAKAENEPNLHLPEVQA